MTAGEGLQQLFALFGHGLQIERVFRLVGVHIAVGVGRVDVEGAAEAGLHRAGAGHGDDGAVLPAILVVGIYRLGQEHVVQHAEGPRVAGPHAEDYEVLGLPAGVDQLDLLILHFEIHQVFSLGEEEILGGADGVQRVRPLGSLGPFLVFRACGGIHRQVQALVLRNGGEELIQLGKADFAHLTHGDSPFPRLRRAPDRPECS